MTRGRRGIASRQCRPTPYPLPSSTWLENMHHKKYSKVLVKKDWEDATCSVCMECPHNAVLLLCSSNDNGCHPYMCGTSFRFSSCLDQYKKAYTKIMAPHHSQPHGDMFDSPALNRISSQPVEKCEVTEFSCPLCRGQVKAWTVVEPAREYLNAKKRSCMQKNCSFVGNYKELQKHVRLEHPSAKPRDVDPILEQKWRRLGLEQERDDVISTIRSSMPNAVVFGDYVIEGTRYGFDEVPMGRDGGFDIDSYLLNVFFLFQALGSSGNGSLNSGVRMRERDSNHIQTEGAAGVHNARPFVGSDSYDQDSNRNYDGDTNNMSLVNRLCHQGRVLLGRSGRRRRRREANVGRGRSR